MFNSKEGKAVWSSSFYKGKRAAGLHPF